MINKILKPKQAIEIAKKLREQKRSIVLVGGVFDILHIGHIKFLEKAKERGNILFVFLESDETARKTKGKNRPINTQKIRAQVLSSVEFVDYIIVLPEMKNDANYDKLVSLIHPIAIAITANDKNIKHKIRQAELIDTKVISVVSEIENKSTTKIAKIIEEENNL